MTAVDENNLRRSLEADDPVFGASVTTFSPTIVEILGDLGLDFAWLDFEHAGPSPYDSTVFEELTRAAAAADIELLVRLPTSEPALIRKVLDAGVRTVLIPRVETATEVQRAVAAARFSYDGEVGDRGVGIGRTSRWGGALDDIIDQEHTNVLVGTMIENERALNNIDEILQVPELGFAFVGPADLSVSLGHPLDTGHPEVESAVTTVRDACIEAGVPVGCIRSSADAATTAVEKGYRVIRIGGDTSSLRNVLSERLEMVDNELDQ